MDDPASNSTDARFDDVTVEVASPLPGRSDEPGPSRAPPVSLVEGSRPCMSSELQVLLHRRLRAVSLILLAGSLAFLGRDFLVYGLANSAALQVQSQVLHAGGWMAHLAVAAILGGCAAVVFRACPMPTRTLRALELVIFAVPAAFMAYLQYLDMTACAEHGFLPSPAAGWLVLIFTYALFIPNNWPRAAVIIGSLAAVPVSLAAWLVLTHEACSHVADNGSFISALGLVMTLSAVAAVVGVHTIGGLRHQAFEARQLGQYRLRKRIGSGGMGEVYLAEHQLLKRPCAIKLIRPEKAGDPLVLARFEREVRSTAKLSHWNSIDIFDYGHASDGTFYYVMEYLPGMNLSQMVHRYGPLPPQRVIHFLLQTCDALEEAHGIGLVHRDIKPANLFAAYRGGRYDVAKLLDFGLAKPMSADQPSHLTQEGTITGSPLYMSPEQAIGESEPDARSDIYCLGAVASFLLTGHPPFDHDNPIKVMLAHANDEPPDLTGAVPSDLNDVVRRCMAKDPDDRYQVVTELASALQQCDVAGEWNWATAAQWWRDVRLETVTPGAAVV